MDGTLLNYDMKIPESAVDAIQQLRKNGVLAVLSTGRPMSTIPKPLIDIGFDGIVAGGGTSVYYKGEKMQDITLPQEVARKYVEVFEKHNVKVVMEGPEFIYVPDVADDDFEADRRRYGEWGMDIMRSWGQEDIVVNKMTYQKKIVGDVHAVVPYLEDEFVHMSYDLPWGDFFRKGHTKASGMQVMMDELGISAQETAAFGDSENDLEMFDMVGYSIAMGNGNDTIKQASDYVTDPVDDNGIYNGLKHLGLI